MGELHFFYGTLRDAALREKALGRAAAAEPAWLDGYETRVARNANGHELTFPIIVPAKGGKVEGVLVCLSADEEARLAFYELGYRLENLTVHRADGAPVSARVETPAPGAWGPGAAWDFDAWRARWGAVVTAAADEYMALRGHVTPEVASIRYPMILVRAASRLRAEAEPEPASLRRVPVAGDVTVENLNRPYARFFAVEEYALRHRRFSGAMTRTLERAAFVSGDATVVLPYDPVRDRVLLIEQFRVGPFARGARNPWSIEAIAGRVDPGETPEDAARREAGEEAGVTLHDLLPAPCYYPSPGAKTEYVYSYVALADLPDGVARPGGLEEEGEDIRPHLIPFEALMDLVRSGEAGNAPLVILALWLERERPRLRAKGLEGRPSRA